MEDLALVLGAGQVVEDRECGIRVLRLRRHRIGDGEDQVRLARRALGQLHDAVLHVLVVTLEEGWKPAALERNRSLALRQCLAGPAHAEFRWELAGLVLGFEAGVVVGRHRARGVVDGGDVTPGHPQERHEAGRVGRKAHADDAVLGEILGGLLQVRPGPIVRRLLHALFGEDVLVVDEAESVEVLRQAVDLAAVGEGVDERRNEVTLGHLRLRHQVVERHELACRHQAADPVDVDVEDVRDNESRRGGPRRHETAFPEGRARCDRQGQAR